MTSDASILTYIELLPVSSMRCHALLVLTGTNSQPKLIDADQMRVAGHRLCFAVKCLAKCQNISSIDPSFYKFGHFRADAVPELAAGTPVYQGTPYCLTCHEERLADWSTSAHSTVQCEVCHGTQRDCPVDGVSRIPADKIKLCTTCHEAMPARPAAQPQIDLAEHPFPDEETPQCHTCHDRHSPGPALSGRWDRR